MTPDEIRKGLGKADMIHMFKRIVNGTEIVMIIGLVSFALLFLVMYLM